MRKLIICAGVALLAGIAMLSSAQNYKGAESLGFRLGWSRHDAGNNELFAVYYVRGRYVSLFGSVQELPEDSKPEEGFIEAIGRATAEPPEGSQSRLPAGAKVRSDERLTAVLYGRLVAVSQVTAHPMFDGQRTRKGAELSDQDYRLAEGLSRHLLAKHVASGFRQAGESILNGRSLGMTFRSDSGEIMVDVEAYASAKRLSFSRDEVLGTVTLRQGETQLLLPLAAKSARIGSRWVSLNELISLRNEKTLAPLDDLERFF